MPRELTADLAGEYSAIFSGLAIRPERRQQAARLCRSLLQPDNRARYEAVEEKTGVPWFVAGIIHSLECSCRFDQHLHNGDPLTGRTVRVPKGRPESNPAAGLGREYTWMESAIDALSRKLPRRAEWTIPAIAFTLESYNGFGYRNRVPWVKSPYLWSFSTAYTAGKFVGDHAFSPTAMSEQCGGMVLLRLLMDADDAIAARVAGGRPAPPPPDPDDDPVPTPHEADTPTRRDWPTPPRMFAGAYLAQGAGGPAVRTLQGRLTEVGAAPDPTGTFDAVTKLAVQLFQARSVDEEGVALQIDGVVGPVTWKALFGPDSVAAPAPASPRVPPSPSPGMSSLAEKVVDIAFDQIGVMEQPPGSNRGPMVDAYLRSAGVPPGNAWCMAFVYWVHQQAVAATPGSRLLVPKTGLVRDSWTQSRNNPAVRTLRPDEVLANPLLVTPGMVFFLGFGNGTGHAGIVVENQGGRLTTIEGNSNDNGSREGIGVFLRRKRGLTASALLGFASFG